MTEQFFNAHPVAVSVVTVALFIWMVIWIYNNAIRRRNPEWHSWFAWYPVVVGRGWKWLKRIERRQWWSRHPYDYDGYGQELVTEYRPVRKKRERI